MVLASPPAAGGFGLTAYETGVVWTFVGLAGFAFQAPIYTRFTPDLHLIYTWFTPGLHLVNT